MYNKLLIVLHFINTIPNQLYPGTYLEAEDHNILSTIFWWRELFHILGGALIGGLFYWMPSLITISAVALVIGLKEFLGDASEQANGIDFKNFVDTGAWVLGTLLVVGWKL